MGGGFSVGGGSPSGVRNPHAGTSGTSASGGLLDGGKQAPAKRPRYNGKETDMRSANPSIGYLAKKQKWVATRTKIESGDKLKNILDELGKKYPQLLNGDATLTKEEYLNLVIALIDVQIAREGRSSLLELISINNKFPDIKEIIGILKKAEAKAEAKAKAKAEALIQGIINNGTNFRELDEILAYLTSNT